jgi:hypothetical protein
MNTLTLIADIHVTESNGIDSRLIQMQAVITEENRLVSQKKGFQVFAIRGNDNIQTKIDYRGFIDLYVMDHRGCRYSILISEYAIKTTKVYEPLIILCEAALETGGYEKPKKNITTMTPIEYKVIYNNNKANVQKNFSLNVKNTGHGFFLTHINVEINLSDIFEAFI